MRLYFKINLVTDALLSQKLFGAKPNCQRIASSMLARETQI